MSSGTRVLLIAATAFLAAIVGVFVGNRLLPHNRSERADLHEVLHNKLDLDENQRSKLEDLERRFAVRRKAIEHELRSDNAVLAEAIEQEHGYGPKVASAVDHSHQAMGQLQKETLSHVFLMRQLLHAGQLPTFDRAVTEALTDEGK